MRLVTCQVREPMVHHLGPREPVEGRRGDRPRFEGTERVGIHQVGGGGRERVPRNQTRGHAHARVVLVQGSWPEVGAGAHELVARKGRRGRRVRAG